LTWTRILARRVEESFGPGALDPVPRAFQAAGRIRSMNPEASSRLELAARKPWPCGHGYLRKTETGLLLG